MTAKFFFLTLLLAVQRDDVPSFVKATSWQIVCNPSDSNPVTCHHGGMCEGNEESGFSCKCGVDPDTGFHYGGSSCTEQLDGVTICNEDDGSIAPEIHLSGVFRCMNGGQCVKDDDTDEWSCDCEHGSENGTKYGGSHCEHVVTDSCAPSNEEDVCYQGVCQNQDNSEESPDGRNMRVRSRLSDTGCTCAEGWHGPQCQLNSGDNTASKTCPDGETTCLNGSTCVKVLNEEAENVDSRKHLYRCDCYTANQMHDTQFGGAQCEIHLGNFDNYPTIHPAPPGLSSCHSQTSSNEEYSSVHFSICLNGGSCTSLVNHVGEMHSDCQCPENFEGAHCEIPKLVPGATSNSCFACDGLSSMLDCHYCENGGTCDQYTFVSDHTSICKCPHGFTGDTCKVEVDTEENDSENLDASGDDSNNSSGSAINVTIFFVGLAGGVALSFIMFKNKHLIGKRKHSSTHHLDTGDASPQMNSITSSEVDEMCLEDKEIL